MCVVNSGFLCARLCLRVVIVVPAYGVCRGAWCAAPPSPRPARRKAPDVPSAPAKQIRK